jgi:hypothetical protein
MSIYILSAHLLQGLPSVLFPSVFKKRLILLVADHSFELSVLLISVVLPLYALLHPYSYTNHTIPDYIDFATYYPV